MDDAHVERLLIGMALIEATAREAEDELSRLLRTAHRDASSAGAEPTRAALNGAIASKHRRLAQLQATLTVSRRRRHDLLNQLQGVDLEAWLQRGAGSSR